MLHVNDGEDRPYCRSKSKHMTADSDESNCKACNKAIAEKFGVSLWDNNEIQFARLLCELVANCDDLKLLEVSESMDLDMIDIRQLFDRAHDVWEASKAKHCPPPEQAENTRKAKLAKRIEAEAKAGNPLFWRNGLKKRKV
jgi:hypothetical protein